LKKKDGIFKEDGTRPIHADGSISGRTPYSKGGTETVHPGREVLRRAGGPDNIKSKRKDDKGIDKTLGNLTKVQEKKRIHEKIQVR